eukprot:c19635_g1_i1.p2 GENE.c19635_g1_i1~~c19635_g1_i1.p2  ORF type:complete len:119 (-),score=30.10 c19635_g1_i1:46-402(-)
MAQMLKEQFITAKKLLDQDVEVLTQADKAAAKNQAKLSQESSRLEAQINKTNKTSTFMNFVLVMVLVLFTVTYFVIKLFPVRKQDVPTGPSSWYTIWGFIERLLFRIWDTASLALAQF